MNVYFMGSTLSRDTVAFWTSGSTKACDRGDLLCTTVDPLTGSTFLVPLYITEASFEHLLTVL